MIRGKLKVILILVVPRRSSKISTRFGHVQVERDLALQFFIDQLKLFFKTAATGRHALDRAPAKNKRKALNFADFHSFCTQATSSRGAFTLRQVVAP